VHPPEYVAARRVLLDALEALGEQRQALVLVGAQTIYLHTGAWTLATAEYTTDADIAVDTTSTATALRALTADDLAGNVAREAVAWLPKLFGSVASAGSQMAARAAAGAEDPDVVAASCAALVAELLAAVER